MVRRHQDRRCSALAGEVERRLGEAQQIICARSGAAPQLIGIGRVDAHRKSSVTQRAHDVFKMRKGRVWQAANIDYVRAGGTHRCRTRQNGVDTELRSINNLGKDACIVAREIRRAPALAEIGRQVLKFIRAALERHAEFRAQPIEIGATASRQQDSVRLDGARQPIGDDLLRHQRRHLDADVAHRPMKRRRAETGHDFLKPWLRQVPGQQQNALRLNLMHRWRARACVPPRPAPAQRASPPRACPRTI